MVASLARYLQNLGKKVAILSRGYKGRRKNVTCISDGSRIYFKPPEVGEEAYWLARTLTGAAVYTAPSRYAAGLAAWQDFRPDVFLLDDGFQHIQLHRDLDIVLLDAEAPFDQGHVLPRGRLREPVAVLGAADVLILTRFEPQRHQAQLGRVKTRFPDKLILTAAISPTGVRRVPGGEERPLEDLRGLALLAFAGLARPRVFTRTLEDLGVKLTAFRAFPDHHEYNDGDLTSLVQEAAGLQAPALITTSKDFARLGETWRLYFPLWVLEVEAQVAWAVLELVWQRILGK
jgi:tetraacyldisaccharide 4'-kinase